MYLKVKVRTTMKTNMIKIQAGLVGQKNSFTFFVIFVYNILKRVKGKTVGPVFDPPQGHLQHESDEVYVPSPPCNDTPHVDLGDMDETHCDDNDYNTWDDVWTESIPNPQDT
nr:uncharacterized protein LOC109180081 [Ipomoea batatas]